MAVSMLRRDSRPLHMHVCGAGLGPQYTFSLLVTLTTRTPLENCLAAAKSGDFTTVKEIFASGIQGPEVSDIFSCLGFKTFSGG